MGEQSVASANADARRTPTSEKSLGSQNGNRREITAEAKKVFRRLIGGEKHNVSNFVPKDFKLVVFHEQEIRSVEKKVFRRLIGESGTVRAILFQISSYLWFFITKKSELSMEMEASRRLIRASYTTSEFVRNFKFVGFHHEQPWKSPEIQI